MHGTLVFDGECGFCTRCRDVLTRLDRNGRLVTMAAQQQLARQKTGLDLDELRKSVLWLDRDGTTCRGAAAINAALTAATGSRLFVLLYRLPGMRQAQEAVYRLVAANRHRFPGSTPWCHRHPQHCAH
jgi:predicted DCC family thiol-disulfide oxidoreductase YuxK